MMTRAFIFLNTEAKADFGIMLKKFRDDFQGSLLESYVLYGMYDMVLKLEARSPNELRYKVEQVRKYDKVSSTHTMIILDDS